jgi:hypothetical protein
VDVEAGVSLDHKRQRQHHRPPPATAILCTRSERNFDRGFVVKQRRELGWIFLIGSVALPFGCAAQQKIMGEPVHGPVAIVVPGIVGALTGPSNRMVVDCGVFLEPHERRVLWQRFDVGKGLNGAGEAGAGRNAGQSILQRIFPRASPGGAGLANRNAPPKAAPASAAPSDHQ